MHACVNEGMHRFLGLAHKAVVLSDPTSWGCFEHEVRGTHQGLISGLDAWTNAGALAGVTGQDPRPWKARKAVCSPSTRVGCPSGLISDVRTWFAGKITSFSLDCTPGALTAKSAQHPLNVAQLSWLLWTVHATPTEARPRKQVMI